jgi:isoamylase
MVRSLHEAGIEVILDVVYNHTARATTTGPRCASAGSTTRPTTAWRPDSERYIDYTGCGNS